MKKFIINTSYFILPLFLLYYVNQFFYDTKEGDLVRLGNLYSNPCPSSLIKEEYTKHDIKYKLLSNLDLSNKVTTDIVTIGDSFSEQGEYGYQNYLALEGFDLLHLDVDKALGYSDPVQKLIGLINSGFFDEISTQYVVIQSAERFVNQRTNNVDFNYSIPVEALKKDSVNMPIRNERSLSFFSDATLKIPVTNILYQFQIKPKYAKTYKVELDKTGYFSNEPGNLLFFQQDYENLKVKNNKQKTYSNVNSLNKINKMLAVKDIELVVLISPDKYDLYYDHIKHKHKLEKPNFFNIYNGLKKDYIDIKTYNVLRSKIPVRKNVYYYDDTHWSPLAAKQISQTIISRLQLR